MAINDLPRTLWWDEDNHVIQLVDQTRLPLVGDILSCNNLDGLIMAIKALAVRGAPALGVSGGMGVALWAVTEGAAYTETPAFMDALKEAADTLANARPTAVNLSWGVKRALSVAQAAADAGKTPEEIGTLLVEEGKAMADEDEQICRTLGAHGASLFTKPTRFLTHCNAGSLATAFYGTALGVIFATHEQGNVEHVWVDETRPVNQGGRLTAWELLMAEVPSALICDNMAASIMRNGWVDAVVVGADRICANGDTANKIGTYGVACLAEKHGVPFYIAAPASTFDLSLSEGSQIEIEERDPREIEGFTVSGTLDPQDPLMADALDRLTAAGTCELPMSKGHHMQIDRKGGGYAFDAWFKNTPTHVECYNPAFDVTPGSMITGFITEKGVITPDAEGGYTSAIARTIGELS